MYYTEYCGTAEKCFISQADSISFLKKLPSLEKAQVKKCRRFLALRYNLDAPLLLSFVLLCISQVAECSSHLLAVTKNIYEIEEKKS
jgi:hypothetical protein